MYFFIKSAMNGKVLDIEGGSKHSGAKVVMYDQKDVRSADNQLWFEDRYGNIRSKLNPQLILDASGKLNLYRCFRFAAVFVSLRRGGIALAMLASDVSNIIPRSHSYCLSLPLCLE